MNIREYAPIISEVVPLLQLNTQYQSDGGNAPYLANELNSLRKAILRLSPIDISAADVERLKSSVLFQSDVEALRLTYEQRTEITRIVDRIKDGLEYVQNYVMANALHIEHGLHVKLPEVGDFEELEKIANELKRGIDIPLHDLGHEVRIVGAEQGSVWLTVILGSAAAVNLVGAICWAAAVLRKKHAEAKIFEQHARTLVLKNDALDILIKAQEQQISNVLDHEASAIQKKHYNSADPETLTRLKLSISSIAELIEKGGRILPEGKNDEVKKLFPDYSQLSIIESSIRQIVEGSQNGKI